MDRDERFDEMLNEGTWPIVAGMEFAPADILAECDPIAYRCYLNDYLDSFGDSN